MSLTVNDALRRAIEHTPDDETSRLLQVLQANLAILAQACDKALDWDAQSSKLFGEPALAEAEARAIFELLLLLAAHRPGTSRQAGSLAEAQSMELSQ